MESPNNPSEGDVLGSVEAFDKVFDTSLLVPHLTAVSEDREDAGDVELVVVFGKEATCR